LRLLDLAHKPLGERTLPAALEQHGARVLFHRHATGGNVIRGNLSLTNNKGPSFIVDNTIAGYLACQNNAPVPASSGNTAESFQGQCAA
jgi:hypothetical protein